MEYLCKLIGTTQASCVFFSAFSIVLIAVDRFMFIVHPTSTQISTPQVNISENSNLNCIFNFRRGICQKAKLNSFKNNRFPSRHLFYRLLPSSCLHFCLLLYFFSQNWMSRGASSPEKPIHIVTRSERTEQ